MRLFLSALAAAAALAPAGTAAANWEQCTPVRVAGACAGMCTDPCVPHAYAYAWCEHPLPYAWCDTVRVNG